LLTLVGLNGAVDEPASDLGGVAFVGKAGNDASYIVFVGKAVGLRFGTANQCSAVSRGGSWYLSFGAAAGINLASREGLPLWMEDGG
jgi:hypothetical protein